MTETTFFKPNDKACALSIICKMRNFCFMENIGQVEDRNVCPGRAPPPPLLPSEEDNASKPSIHREYKKTSTNS